MLGAPRIKLPPESSAVVPRPSPRPGRLSATWGQLEPRRCAGHFYVTTSRRMRPSSRSFELGRFWDKQQRPLNIQPGQPPPLPGSAGLILSGISHDFCSFRTSAVPPQHRVLNRNAKKKSFLAFGVPEPLCPFPAFSSVFVTLALNSERTFQTKRHFLSLKRPIFC